VTMHGSVARDRMPEFYRQAAFLCSTSEFEGFPNTFLEAWSHGLPVVSTFDPDDLIATVGLGATAGDVQGLIAGIRQLLGSPKRYQQSSANARRYYLENHTVEAVMPQFERVFRDAVNGIRT
jgi:glycosyltransferase involved in cell wall biosynthesis